MTVQEQALKQITISLPQGLGWGTLVTMLAIVVGGIAYMVNQDNRLSTSEAQILQLSTQLSAMSRTSNEVERTLVRIDGRLDATNERLDWMLELIRAGQLLPPPPEGNGNGPFPR